MTAAVTTPVESFKLVATGLPVAPLLELLQGMPHLWERNTQRQTYPGSAHKDTRCILLRMPEAILAGKGGGREWFRDLNVTDDEYAFPVELWEAVDEIVAPIVTATKARKIARVMIVELREGGEVTEHVDTGPYADHTDRVHVCLQAESGMSMLKVDRPDGYAHSAHFAAGDAWWFNTKLPHMAWNESESTPRIHLIVDLVSPDLRTLRTEGTYSIHPELVSECWDEILPLCARHKDEIAHYQDIDLKVDTAAYERLEAEGKLRLYAVRALPSWELIGYQVVMVGPNIHYADSKQAKVDVLYIAPEHRRGRLGIRLIDYADSMLRDEGVQVVYHHCKHAFDFGPMLARLGYESIETIHGRRLDKG